MFSCKRIIDDLNFLLFFLLKRRLDFNLYHKVLAALKEFPPLNVIFAVNRVDEGIFRAVRGHGANDVSSFRFN